MKKYSSCNFCFIDIYMVEANSIHRNAEINYKEKTMVDHADFVNSISLYCPAAVGAHAGTSPSY